MRPCASASVVVLGSAVRYVVDGGLQSSTELWEKQQLYAVWEIQDLLERWRCSRQVTTLLAAPDQKVALLVIPGWASAVPVLPVLLVLWSPQEPKKSLLMYIITFTSDKNFLR